MQPLAHWTITPLRQQQGRSPPPPQGRKQLQVQWLARAEILGTNRSSNQSGRRLSTPDMAPSSSGRGMELVTAAH
jgi:hypothetical protein